MDKNTCELSSRYYPAEILVCILGAVLVLHKWLRINLDQPLPYLNIKLQNQAFFPHIVSAMLFAALLYLFLEFKQSQEKAKGCLLSKVRVSAATLCGIIGFWVIHPELVKNTVYEGISPIWYPAFLSIGLMLGFFAQIIIFSTLMIRDPQEAKTLNLPRIPNATRAQYFAGGPVFLLLLSCYFALYFFASDSIRLVASLLTALGFLYMVFSEIVFLFLHRDINGNRVSYTERIARFKEIHSCHDRSYDLIDYELKASADIGVKSSDQPKELQNKVCECFSVNKETKIFNFHVQQLEEIQIKLFPKDGNPENLAPDNSGFKILKKQGDKDRMRVLFKPDTPDIDDVELVVPINKVEEYAEKYIAAVPENTKPDHIKIFSKAINQTVLETLQKDAGALLPGAAMHGDIDAVQGLIKQGHDVNARGEGGWTALLSSSAQGYPKIMKILLDAGANPDISNVLGITPLNYGARYGNIEVVKMLIEYGADINIRDTHGDSALMKATEFGNIEVVEILIQSGADTTIRNFKKKNALNLAYELGHGKIAKILHKADNNPVNYKP